MFKKADMTSGIQPCAVTSYICKHVVHRHFVVVLCMCEWACSICPDLIFPHVVHNPCVKEASEGKRLSHSPWWEAGQRRTPTCTPSYSLTGNHKRQPAAKHLNFIIITVHLNIQHMKLSSLLVVTATHNKEQMLCPLHVLKKLVSHAFVQVSSLNQTREIRNRNLPKTQKRHSFKGGIITLTYPQTCLSILACNLRTALCQSPVSKLWLW